MRCLTCGQDRRQELIVLDCHCQDLGRICASCGTWSPAQAHSCVSYANDPPIPDSTSDMPPIIDGAKAANTLANGRFGIKKCTCDGNKMRVFLVHDGLLDREFGVSGPMYTRTL